MLGVACCSYCCNVRLLSTWKGVAIRAIRRHLMGQCRDLSKRRCITFSLFGLVVLMLLVGAHLSIQPENRSV